MIELTPEQREVRAWAREFARRHIAPRALALDKAPESSLRVEAARGLVWRAATAVAAERAV